SSSEGSGSDANSGRAKNGKKSTGEESYKNVECSIVKNIDGLTYQFDAELLADGEVNVTLSRSMDGMSLDDELSLKLAQTYDSDALAIYYGRDNATGDFVNIDRNLSNNQIYVQFRAF